jgi:hypothetical protein
MLHAIFDVLMDCATQGRTLMVEKETASIGWSSRGNPLLYMRGRSDSFLKQQVLTCLQSVTA